jgi:hypothetical protein
MSGLDSRGICEKYAKEHRDRAIQRYYERPVRQWENEELARRSGTSSAIRNEILKMVEGSKDGVSITALAKIRGSGYRDTCLTLNSFKQCLLALHLDPLVADAVEDLLRNKQVELVSMARNADDEPYEQAVKEATGGKYFYSPFKLVRSHLRPRSRSDGHAVVSSFRHITPGGSPVRR